MIRDKNRIYGEMNDPNTVLASGTLAANKFLVGAGNKGVKTYAPGAKRVLTTDENGDVSSFEYGTPNKAIGTDASGNLTLLDIVDPTTFFEFGTANNPCTGVALAGAGAAGASATYTNLSGGGVLVSVTKTSSSYAGIEVTMTFQTALTLTAAKSCRVCAQGMADFQSMKDIIFITTSGTEFKVQEGSAGEPASGSGACCNKTITIPAGTYNKVKIGANMLTGEVTDSALVFTCLLAWQ